MFGLLTKSLLWQFQFVKYTVYMGMIALDRRKLLDKVVKGSEICEVLHGCPEVQKYLVSCSSFNHSLLGTEINWLC